MDTVNLILMIVLLIAAIFSFVVWYKLNVDISKEDKYDLQAEIDRKDKWNKLAWIPLALVVIVMGVTAWEAFGRDMCGTSSTKFYYF